MPPADIQHVIDQPGGYRLSEGVYATRDGLFFSGDMSDLLSAAVIAWDYPADHSFQCGHLFPWDTAAERLRYQEGQPCAWIAQDRDPIYCGMKVNEERRILRLHRVAALLCDDAPAFAVLHWCTTELGDRND